MPTVALRPSASKAFGNFRSVPKAFDHLSLALPAMVRRLSLRNIMDIAYFIIYTNTMAGNVYAGKAAQDGDKGEPPALIDETLSAAWQWSGSPKYAYDDIPNTLSTTAHIHTLSFRP